MYTATCSKAFCSAYDVHLKYNQTLGIIKRTEFQAPFFNISTCSKVIVVSARGLGLKNFESNAQAKKPWRLLKNRDFRYQSIILPSANIPQSMWQIMYNTDTDDPGN